MVVLAILGLLVAVLVRNVGGDLDRGQEQAASLFVKTTSIGIPALTIKTNSTCFPKAVTKRPARTTTSATGKRRRLAVI